MLRPPRKIKTDRLVSWSLLSYAYIIAGIMEVTGCLTAYCLVFVQNNIAVSDLLFTDESFFFTEASLNSPFYSNNRVFSGEEQSIIVGQARSAWYE